MWKQLLKAGIYFSFFISLATYAQNITRPTVPVPNGFEVNSYTGNLYHSRTDLKIPGQGLNIDLTFSYNLSRRSKNRGMGNGWTFNYNMVYVADPSGIWVERPDGKRELYQKSGSVYIAPAGIYDELVEYQTGKFYLKTKEDLRYYFDNTSHKRLTKMQDANGNVINVAYNDTLISTLTDGTGHNIGFTWSNARLTEITDNSCSPVRKILYAYDSKGNPIKVTNPIGDFVNYKYDPTFKIIGYTDESGNNMSMVYNTNNAVTRITSCITTHLFSYLPQQLKTYVTEKVNGQSVVTAYSFDEQGRVISKKGNCCGFNVDYVYDAKNNVSSLLDGNKKETKYLYDSKGNVTKAIDPVGNFVTYSFESSYNKVIGLTDKNGNNTTFQYNSAGNLTQINKPLGVTEKYTYDAKGNKLSYTDGNNNVTTYEYDSKGYLTKTTNPEGGVTTYTYDCYGNLLTETNPRNYTTTYQYNALSQLIRETDALNNSTIYAYNKQGQISSVTNPLGKTTHYGYDGLGRRISTTLPMGNINRTEYDEQGNSIKETDPAGNAVTFTYNNRKQPLTVTNALGYTLFYEYDEAGNKLSETDKNGNKTRYEYDEQYRLIKQIDALEGTTQYSYDAMGNRTAAIDANGNATAYQYDALNRLIKMTDPVGKSVQYTYDGKGNRLTEKDKNGNTTTYTYDKLDRVKTITDALGGVRTSTYDANGNIISEKNPLNNTTNYSYDALDRQTTFTNPLSEITTYTYDALGNRKTIIQPNGNTITNTYNDNNQLITIADAIGPVSAYTYDNAGNVLTEKDGNNNTTVYQYDASNQLTKITFPNSTTFRFVYDANGNKTKEINQKGLATLFSYDKLNKTVSITDALGSVSFFIYDPKGNLINIIDAKGNSISYNYDSRNKLIKQTYPDGSSKKFTYDSNELIISRTDNNGITTQYKYDKLNRLVERNYPGNVNETFSYNAIGQMLTAVNANATVTFNYDAADRLLKEDLNGKAITYEYNTSAKTKKKNYPSGVQLVWQMDNRDRLIEIKEGGASLVNLQYDANNQLTNTQFRNNTSTTHSYDKMGNLTGLAAVPNTILNIAFKYDSSDKRIITERIHKPTRSEQYDYDAIFQLSNFATGQYSNGVVNPALQHQFTYDALGNRLTSKEGTVNKAYTVNNVNQYTSINTNGSNAPPTYNKNGNLLNDGFNTYTYDYENRLITVQNSSGTINYKYDALGRRISRISGGNETLYSYDLDNVIEQRSSTSTKSFVYGSEIDQILYAKTSNASYYYYTDDLNSVHAITDASGALVEYYTYDPFGTPHVFSPANVELATSSINTILYTGREYDFLSKTYNYRNREMNPTMGRFSQRDPLEFIDGLNNYAYVNNDVVNDTDPSGLVKWGGVGSSLLGILGNVFDARWGIGLTATGYGAVVGIPLLVNTGYELSGNIGNLWDAINDREPSNTVSAAQDLVNHFYPCNESLRQAARDFDLVKGLIGIRAAVKGISKTFSNMGEVIADRGKNILRSLLPAERATAQQGTKLAQTLGKAGEEAVGTIGSKIRIPSLTESAKYRIPDRLTATTLEEVKNVNRLALTGQIRDYYLYSQQTGRQFILYTRSNTTFTRPLQKLIDQGDIIVKPIPR